VLGLLLAVAACAPSRPRLRVREPTGAAEAVDAAGPRDPGNYVGLVFERDTPEDPGRREESVEH